MRMTRLQIVLMGCLVLGIVVPTAFTQFRMQFGGPGGGDSGGGPGGGRGGRGGRGGGRGNMTEMIFNSLSGGKDEIDVSKLQIDPRFLRGRSVEEEREKMMKFLQTKGVSNGIMKKEHYTEYFEVQMKERTKADSEKRFSQMSGGAASFDVTKVQIPTEMVMWESADAQKQKMADFLKSKGISNNLMTKELYAEYREGRTREFRERMEKGDNRSKEEKDKEAEARARDIFKALDSNSDNVLTKDELEKAREKNTPGSNILYGFDRYDNNKNGKIELDEYIGYIKDRTGGRDRNRDEKRDDKRAEEPAYVKPVIDETRPTVFRVGKLPKELPEWYGTNDSDKDGQVGLYEWKKEGKSVKEFLAMDINGDGFVTAEEYIRYQKAQSKTSGSTSVAYGGNGNNGGNGAPPAMGNGSDRGGRRGGMRAGPPGANGEERGKAGRFGMFGGGKTKGKQRNR